MLALTHDDKAARRREKAVRRAYKNNRRERKWARRFGRSGDMVKLRLIGSGIGVSAFFVLLAFLAWF